MTWKQKLLSNEIKEGDLCFYSFYSDFSARRYQETDISSYVIIKITNGEVVTLQDSETREIHHDKWKLSQFKRVRDVLEK